MDIVDAEAWIETKLLDSEALQAIVDERVYRYLAPMAAQMPYVVLSVTNGRDTNGVGTARLLTNFDAVVRVVGPVNMVDKLDEAAKAADTILISGSGYPVGCVRQNPLGYISTDNGQITRSVGGRYRVIG